MASLALGASPGGATHITLRLHPAELGSVQIRIDRPSEDPVRVEVMVARPETLSLLVHDQSQLHHALDQAGLPANRVLNFSLAEHAGQPGGQAGAQDGRQADTRTGGGKPAAGPASASDTTPETTPIAIPAHFTRAGIDITA